MNVTRGVSATPTSFRQLSTATDARGAGKASAARSLPTRPMEHPHCFPHPSSQCHNWASPCPATVPRSHPYRKWKRVRPFGALTIYSPLYLKCFISLSLFVCVDDDGVHPRIPVSLATHSVAAAQAAAAHAATIAQVAALEQLREKFESGEPPEKKIALPLEEHQRLLQRALQHNLLAMTAQIPMNIRINNQGTDISANVFCHVETWNIKRVLCNLSILNIWLQLH